MLAPAMDSPVAAVRLVRLYRQQVVENAALLRRKFSLVLAGVQHLLPLRGRQIAQIAESPPQW